MDYDKAYAIISQILLNTGWSPDTQLTLETTEQVSGLIHASNNIDDWQLQVKIDKDIEQKVEQLNNQHGLGITDPVDKALYGVSKHELGHWEFCPRNADLFTTIMEGVSSGLTLWRGKDGESFSEDDIKSATPHVENMFSDTIVNCAQVLDQRYLEGLSLLHSTRGGIHDSGKHENDAKFSELYGVFADVQMKFGGTTKAQRILLEKTLNGYDKGLKAASKAILEVLIGKEMSEKAFAGKLTKEEKEVAIEEMRDETKWGMKAKAYAMIIAPIVRKNIDALKQMELHGFSYKWSKDPNFRRKIIRKSMEEHGSPPKFADSFEAFDEAYTKAAGKILIDFAKGQQAAKAPSKVDLFHMGMERVSPEEATTRPGMHILWAKTRFYGDTISLARGLNPYAIIKGEKRHDTTSNQDILFVFDASGSMRRTGSILDGSQFDMCIRTYYAVLNFLKAENKLEYLDYGFAKFGDPNTTTFSGWKDWRHIDDISREIMAVRTESSDTIIDTRVIDRAAEEHKRLRQQRSFLLISVSDGLITNSEEALREYISLMKQGNDVVHFRIGGQDDFSTALEAAGAIVVPVESAESLIGITLDIIKKRYSKKPDAKPTPNGNQGHTSTDTRQKIKV